MGEEEKNGQGEQALSMITTPGRKTSTAATTPTGGIEGPAEGATNSEVVATRGRVRLLHYMPTTNRSLRVPILFVYALINRYYILDIQPDRSVVRKYLDRGLDAYIIDWGYPRRVDRYERIEDYIEYIDEFVDLIRERSGSESVNLHGYCIGGTFCAIYSAMYPEKVNSLVIQAAPIDFSTNAGVLNIWAKHIDADKVVDTLGNVPASFLNTSFLLVSPARLLIDKYVNFYENAADENYVQSFMRMERWIFQSPDLTGEFYREFIKDFYQKNKLVKNEFKMGASTVDLQKITSPLLVIVANDDNLVTPDSTTPILELASSKDRELLRFGGGHIGMSVSPSAHKKLWSQAAEWVATRSA